MGICQPKDNINATGEPASADWILYPRPRASAEDSVVRALSESGNRFGTRSPKCIPPTPELYELASWDLRPASVQRRGSLSAPITPTLDPVFVPAIEFFTFLQHKARTPSKFLLYDLQYSASPEPRRIRFAIDLLQCAKFSDVQGRKPQIIDRLRQGGKGKILLMYGGEEGLFSFLVTVIHESGIQPVKIFVLKDCVATLEHLFPAAVKDSRWGLPGPSPVLFHPTEFCLYAWEVESVRRNLDVVTEVCDVRCIVNLSDILLASAVAHLVPKVTVYETFRSDYRSACDMIGAACDIVTAGSATGFPVLIVDDKKRRLAALVSAWWMIEVGWWHHVNEVLIHVTDRVLGVEVDEGFGRESIGALSSLHEALKKGQDVKQARLIAGQVFSPDGESSLYI